MLQAEAAGALPGQAIAVLDPVLEMVVDVFPAEDAHAQERSLLPSVLETVMAGQLWIADRNFCTKDFLTGISAHGASFIISSPRGAKKPTNKKKYDPKHPHVATFRLLTT